jgi:hypothetical protein
VTSCGVLDKPNTLYKQTANIVPVDSSKPCIQVTSSNVIFDGNGHWISNPRLAQSGIYASGVSNIIIQNVKVNMSNGVNGRGVYFAGTKDSSIVNSSFEGNSEGIRLVWGSNNTVQGASIKNSASSGIYVYETQNNKIVDSLIKNKGGITFIYVNKSIVKGVNVLNASSNGITLYSSNWNNLNNFTASSSAMSGVYLSYLPSSLPDPFGGYNQIINGNTDYNGNAGIYIDGSYSNNLTNIRAKGNAHAGINIGKSGDNRVIRSTINNNKELGIYVGSNSAAIIESTSSCGNVLKDFSCGTQSSWAYGTNNFMSNVDQCTTTGFPTLGVHYSLCSI